MFLTWKHKIANHQKTFSQLWKNKLPVMKRQIAGVLLRKSENLSFLFRGKILVQKFWRYKNSSYLCSRASYEAQTFYLLKSLTRIATSNQENLMSET